MRKISNLALFAGFSGLGLFGLLSACGGSGGSGGGTGGSTSSNSDAGPITTPTGNDQDAGDTNVPDLESTGLFGHVYAGAVSGVTVNALSLDGTVLGTTQTDDEGWYALALGNHADLVMLETEGGSATDPVTGEQVDLPPLHAFAAPMTASSPPCDTLLTPLTELAFQLSEQDSAGWQQARNFTSLMAGAVDITCSLPDDPTGTQSTSRSATEHGIAIAALFQRANTDGTDLAEGIAALSADALSGSSTGLQQYVTSVGDFVDSEADMTGLDAGATIIESVTPQVWDPILVPVLTLDVAECGRTYNTGGIFPSLGETRTVTCDPPATLFAVTQGHPSPPVGSECDPLACTSREIVHCGSDVCIEAVAPPEGSKAFQICNWYLDADTGAACEDGLGLLVDDFEVPQPPCDANNQNCKPLFEMVIPPDNNTDGTLITHDGTTAVGFYRAGLDFHPRAWLDRETEPCPSSRYCEHVSGEYLDIGQGSVTRTYKILTTYGYEWEVTFNVPVHAGARTYCDVLSKQCTTLGSPAGMGSSEPVPPGDGTCASICDRILSACGPSSDDCVAECEKDQGNAESCGEGALWTSMLTCCAEADVSAFCAEEGFDPCQKGACADQRPAGAVGGCP